MKTQRQIRKDLSPLVAKIKAFVKREGSSPTVREVAEMASVKSPSHGALLIRQMQKAGLIEFEPRKPRSISVK